jgi:hypothetical protein
MPLGRDSPKTPLLATPSTPAYARRFVSFKERQDAGDTLVIQ